MRSILFAPLVVFAACVSAQSWDDMSPEERDAYVAFQQERAAKVVALVTEKAEEKIAAGEWKESDVTRAIVAANKVSAVAAAYARQDGSFEGQLALQSAVDDLLLYAVALGLDQL